MSNKNQANAPDGGAESYDDSWDRPVEGGGGDSGFGTGGEGDSGFGTGVGVDWDSMYEEPRANPPNPPNPPRDGSPAFDDNFTKPEDYDGFFPKEGVDPEASRLMVPIADVKNAGLPLARNIVFSQAEIDELKRMNKKLMPLLDAVQESMDFYAVGVSKHVFWNKRGKEVVNSSRYSDPTFMPDSGDEEGVGSDFSNESSGEFDDSVVGASELQGLLGDANNTVSPVRRAEHSIDDISLDEIKGLDADSYEGMKTDQSSSISFDSKETSGMTSEGGSKSVGEETIEAADEETIMFNEDDIFKPSGLGYTFFTSRLGVGEGSTVGAITGLLCPRDEHDDRHPDDLFLYSNSHSLDVGSEGYMDLPGWVIDSTPFATGVEPCPTVRYGGGFAPHVCTQANAEIFTFGDKLPTDPNVKVLLSSLGVASYYLHQNEDGSYPNFGALRFAAVVYAIKNIPPDTAITINYHGGSLKTKGSGYWMTPADLENHLQRFPLGPKEIVEYCQCNFFKRLQDMKPPHPGMKKCPFDMARVKVICDEISEEAMDLAIEKEKQAGKERFQKQVDDLEKWALQVKEQPMHKEVEIIFGFNGFDVWLTPTLETVVRAFNKEMIAVLEVVLNNHRQHRFVYKSSDDNKFELVYSPNIRKSIVPTETAVTVLFGDIISSFDRAMRLFINSPINDEVFGAEAAMGYLQNMLRKNHPLWFLDHALLKIGCCTKALVLPVQFREDTFCRPFPHVGDAGKIKLKPSKFEDRHGSIVDEFLNENGLAFLKDDRALLSLLTVGFTIKVVGFGDTMLASNEGIFKSYKEVKREADHLGITTDNIVCCTCRGNDSCRFYSSRISLAQIEKHFLSHGFKEPKGLATSVAITDALHVECEGVRNTALEILENAGKEYGEVRARYNAARTMRNEALKIADEKAREEPLRLAEEAWQRAEEKNTISYIPPEKRDYHVEGFDDFILLADRHVGTPLDTPEGTPPDSLANTPEKTPSSIKARRVRQRVVRDNAGTPGKRAQQAARPAPQAKRTIIPVLEKSSHEPPSKRAKTNDGGSAGAGGGGGGGDGGAGGN
jgi:hypothetical protein